MAENHDSDLVSEVSVAVGIGNGDKSNLRDIPLNQDASHADCKEDMFVDAPDELNFDTPSKEVEAGVNENGMPEGEYMEETDTFAREVIKLQERIKALTNENKSMVHDENTGVGSSLTETVSQFSMFLETVKEELVQHKNTVKELQGVIYGKDREIEDLTDKVSELSVSHDVVISSLNSVAESGSQVQLETNRQIEVVADRIVDSLSTIVREEVLQDCSVIGKITHVENCISLLNEKYDRFLCGIDQLGKCLFKHGSDCTMQEDFGSVLGNACTELLELKRREAELLEKLNHVEDENRKLVQEVDKDRETIELLNADLGKTKMELEQEKTRCANTKEKLSMAVTKGKALVQQRDALKQSLAEKSNEMEKCLVELQERSDALEACESSKGQLEQSVTEKTNELEKCFIELQEKSAALEVAEVTKKELEQFLAEKTKELEECLIKLQEKSTALDAFELSKDELVKSEAIIASLQEGLSQRNSAVENFEAILSQVDVPEEVRSMDTVERVRWLVEESNKLRGVALEFKRLKDAIFSFNLPEEVSQSDLESYLGQIREYFLKAKNDVSALQFQIESLSSSMSTELQEKDNIQKELDDLGSRFREMEEVLHRVSLEKDEIVRRLMETSGFTAKEAGNQTASDMKMLIERSFEKIGEQTSGCTGTSHADAELFERIQSLLYVKDQELSLCLGILGEEKLVRSQVSDLSDNLRMASQELAAVKEENNALQKDLELSEEKCALLREKLSMAVKKGKGLVQDRENLKLQLDEKSTEIEKLKLKVQQLQTTVDECQGQINTLSTDSKRIPELEVEIVTLKDQRSQLEQSLLQSNNMLQKVIESVGSIMIPVTSESEDPLETVSLLAAYFKECQLAKVKSDEELEKAKDEACKLASKLEETHATLKSFEEALSSAEVNINRLSEEKRQVEIVKENIELELQKVVEDASSLASKFEEACTTRKLLEDALMQTERNISDIISEKEDAQSSRASAEMELEKVREVVANQTSNLAEAHKSLKSVENALSDAENNVELLAKQNNDAEVIRTNLENELKKLRDESESQASKMQNASITIKSLEEALMRADNGLSTLQAEKINAELEISTLNSKLNACMEELAGISGSRKSRSLEIIGHLDDLQILLKDDSLVLKVNQFLESNFKSLKNMELIVSDIRDHLAEKGLAAHKIDSDSEDDSSVERPFLNSLDGSVKTELENIHVKDDDISSCIMKLAEGFKMRNKILVDNLEGFSTSMDILVAALSKKLIATRDDVRNLSEHIESMKDNVNNLEITNQEREKAISMLENDVSTLLSACDGAVRELQFKVKNNLLELSNIPELQLKGELNVDQNASAEHLQKLDGSKHVQNIGALFYAASEACIVIKSFERTSGAAAVVIQNLQEKLKEVTMALEKAVEERDVNQNLASSLEADLESLEDSCQELRLQAEDFQAKESKWLEKEAELSSLCNNLLAKDQEAEDPLISASDIRALFDKINGIEMPLVEHVRGMEPEGPYDVKKLFCIIDFVAEMQNRVDILIFEKEELQSALSTKTREIQHLKEEVETQSRDKPDLERMKIELSELTYGLEKLFGISGANDSLGDPKSMGLFALLQALEKQVTSLLLEAENSKTKAQELDVKLLGSQKVVEELSSKVNVLEDSLQSSRIIQPEIVQERSVFDAPKVPSTSEISEIADVGSLGKESIPPVPSAAQVRTIRKGSTDHLTVNIDPESDRLINHDETDEDKGHVFKSLNVSGLIPKQGKMIADRVDGIWVSGGRVLMSRPRARLGVIAYCLFLHLWLLGTIL